MTTRAERVDRFRLILEKMLHDLLSLRESTSQSRETVELDQQRMGRLSRMDAIQVQEMALAADRQRQYQISRIRRALSRIENEEFGYCGTCGDEIPDGRLEADPAAHQCVRCAGGGKA